MRNAADHRRMLRARSQRSLRSVLKHESYEWQSPESTLYIFTRHSFGVGFREGLCPVVIRPYQPHYHSGYRSISLTQDRSIEFRF